MYKWCRISGYLALLLIALTAIPGHAERDIDKLKYPPLADLQMPEVEKYQLDNGIRVYMLEDHELPLVNARAFIAAGGYLEKTEKTGLASICGEVMRTGGTARMTGDEVDETMESIGGSVEVSIGSTGGSARMNILSEYDDLGLQVLADVLRTPQFDQEKIDIAKSSRRTEISSRNDEPFQVCIREFRKLIYGADSPYARHTEYATIDGITREDLIEFHDSYITPENIMLAVWGDFDTPGMKEKINAYFADWPRGSGPVPPLPEVNRASEKHVYYIEKDDVTQSSVLIGHLGGLTGDPDYFALTVANNVLGGGSMTGRILNEVRSRQGLAYSTSGNYTTNIAYPGIFYNYVITKLGTTVKATRAVLDEIERMKTDPPTPEELNNAKNSYLNSFVFNFDSKGEIINRMMTYDYYDFPQDFLFKVKDGIEKVSADDVVDVARRRFHPDAMYVVVVGKADQFDEPLSTLGPVDTIDITIPTGEMEEEIAVTPEALEHGRELLQKAITASGGLENFKKIEALSSKMDIALVTPQGEFSISSSSAFILPDKKREEINTPMGQIITVSSGDQFWIKQGPNVVPAPANEVKNAREEMFRNTFLTFRDFEKPDYKAVYVAPDEIDGKKVEMLKIVSDDGEYSYKMAIDAATYLPAAKYYFGETMMGPANLTEIYSDYREVGGVKVPFNTTVNADGKKVMGLIIREMNINPNLDPAIFDKPE